MIKNSPQTILREKVLVLSFSCVWIFVTPMDCSTLGFPALHYLPEFAQTHVHWDHDAIQPSHPLLPPSLPAHNLSQHQGLFRWVSSSHQVAKLLELQLQYQSFQWIFRVDFLAVQGTLKSLLQHHSSKAVVDQFFGLSFLYSPTLTSLHDYWKNHSFNKMNLC